MATEGIEGIYTETRNYGATAAFWASLGFAADFETGHGSGQWRHATGGPYLFINEQHDRPLAQYPVLTVADSTAFNPARAAEYAQPFTPQHWGVVEADILDPDARPVSLQAPVPAGVAAPDADAHHREKYGA